MTAIDLTYARNAGAEFAEQVNRSAQDRENWREMNSWDDIPEFDYLDLQQHYGDALCDAVGQAYRDGFNDTLESDQ